MAYIQKQADIRKMMLRRPVLLLLILLGIIMPAGAFVVEGPRQSTLSAQEHLAQAPRWVPTRASLLQSGERGLGGGLEYTVDDSICRLNFVDDVDCTSRKRAISEALDQWSSGHPAISFVDVTGQIAPGFPLAVAGQSAQGAEIDFFGSTAEEFPIFRNSQTTGYTVFYERPRSELELTNGTLVSGPIGAIESADVRLNCLLYTSDAADE